jgi:hypothetical protein
MNATFILCSLAIVLGTSLILQGVVLRIVYRRKVTKQHAKHLQFQQTINGQVEQTKRQIGQLQSDLAAARAQLKQGGKSVAAPRQALDRELDDASGSRHQLPVNGFADTQPSPQVTEYGSLLLQ